jgi:hypothetical protein
VITRSESNSPHGSVYYFGRNDAVDARNFFSSDVEPLKQHQYSVTFGGPLRRSKLFFFGFWEGFRNRQGITKTATVPTPQERQGDFSGLRDPSTGNRLINFATGQPFPDNRVPPAFFSTVSQRVLDFFPLGNVSPSLFRTTEVLENESDQGGFKVDAVMTERDQISLRYATVSGSNLNPLSICGADVPGFPTGDELRCHSVTLSHTHVFGPAALHTLRVAFLRYDFLFDKRFNHESPRSLGFNYDSTFEAAQGPPYFIVNGYASVGSPITVIFDVSGYAQDQWRVTRKLTVNYGVRYEINSPFADPRPPEPVCAGSAIERATRRAGGHPVSGRPWRGQTHRQRLLQGSDAAVRVRFRFCG